MKSMKVIIMEMSALVFGLSGCRNTGKQVQQDIFRNDSRTVYEIVP